MACHTAAPPEVELLRCSTCATPWHAPCLSDPPALAVAALWSCPDCSGDSSAAPVAAGAGSDLVAAIRAIEAEEGLSDQEKAHRRQALLAAASLAGSAWSCPSVRIPTNLYVSPSDLSSMTPCGHNFCLKCFQKWIHDGNKTCGKCRAQIPPQMAQQPRVNSAIVQVIRKANIATAANSASSAAPQHYVRNEDRPEKAFTTARAKKAGNANASTGQIFVTTAPDHFGPILAVMTPEEILSRLECRQWGVHLPHIAGIAGQANHGAQSVVLSGGYQDDEDHGEWFLYTGSGGRDLSGNKQTNKDQSFDQNFTKLNAALRLSCLRGYPVRVVRTSDYCFKNFLSLQCLDRSSKEKRSSYAPESGLRYDGIYRVEKCWRKISVQDNYKVCRYLFVRCDNEPAPWTRFDQHTSSFVTSRLYLIFVENKSIVLNDIIWLFFLSDAHGDRPRPLPEIKEESVSTDITERKDCPSWDYDEKEEGWKWMIPPPASKKPIVSENPKTNKKFKREKEEGWKWMMPPPASKKPIVSENPKTNKKFKRVLARDDPISVAERLLEDFGCSICRKVITEPLTTPCAHNFCKTCLLGAYCSQSSTRERSRNGRTLRAQKIVKKCPSCPTDICDFLVNPQPTRLVGLLAFLESQSQTKPNQTHPELMNMIESLQRKAVEHDTKEDSDGSINDEDEDSDGSIDDEECVEKNEIQESLKRKRDSEINTNGNERMKTSATMEGTDDGGC
ncbi:hypothetical protein EJB05_34798, partial [Eragrostis curvula]